MYKANKNQKGSILVIEIVLIFIFSLIMVAILGYAAIEQRVIRSAIAREQAFHIAEAGANYYQWHLAHFANDFTNGTSTPGPYLFDYKDTDAQTIIGQYKLDITAPSAGSTIATIRSTGWTINQPQIKRTVTVKVGIPSLAKYAFLTNDSAWVGNTENISGQLHANGGIRFDGTGNAPITSARATYTCPSWSGSPCPTTKNGIWGSAPTSTQSYWNFPSPPIDFLSITNDLASMRTDAQTDGIYLPPSNAQGYSFEFASSGQVTIYKVTSLRAHQTGWDIYGNAHNEDLDYNNRTFVGTYDLPNNGLIYVEDNSWVEGVVNGRVMLAAATLPYNPNNAPSILIPNNIQYVSHDGSSVLGLISQKDILITYYCPSNLYIDAAMVAQNGSAQRYYFPGDVKSQITIFGSVASFGVWTWSWVDGSNTVISGFQNTGTSYDANLLYSPPPSFPLTSNGYQVLSWSSD